MARVKTRSELEEEIKYLKEELARVDRQERVNEAALEVKASYDALVRAGFTEGQAFKMLLTLAGNVISCS